ncbi:RB1-inducible coiled-coil protein 1 isoform X1 [Ostrinia furnacalis]|uniref:RB1-inducible coiled-coil protein 1 isoform X1 n=1 Tax=Ostrinia furnacalis TaxID=93504 RepID=UPI001038A178|nr:RB1-inducible coiled-coil protein 1 isoform X1 [Ostrinia furnacalis]
MLYIFHVDAGQMTMYDMNLTLQSVASLKAAIEKRTKIPANLLVLLVSGGEVLQSDHMVSSYSAGTDTNPIYMFSKPSVKESHIKQSICSDLSPIPELEPEFRGDGRTTYEGKSIADLASLVENCRSKGPTVHTVMACTQLAEQFSDLAHEVSRSCEQLVHEQHLQHQGWAAVVANLEDIFNEFCERSRNFKESFRKHRLKKDEYHEKLNALNEVLESLGKIPILPALQLNAEAHRFSAFDVFEETDFEGHPYRVSHPLDNSSETKTCQDFGVEALKLSEEEVFENKDASSCKDVVHSSESEQQIEESDEGVTFQAHLYEKDDPTLLHWILAQGNKASLQDILDYCQKGLALIDVEPLKEHEDQLCHILQYANDHGLKQIRGIEDRLFGLDQILSEVKKLERDQHDQAASLIQTNVTKALPVKRYSRMNSQELIKYRDRLNSALDPSVLPTLVQSHICQLEKLLKGHQTLVDRRRRIAKSKEELSQVLRARLEAVLKIENSMSVQDAHAMLSFQCFNRLERYFGIVAQLHQAPAVFVRAVHEVARRRTFSEAHILWAADLAAKLLKIHDEEVTRRQEFNSLFDGHFLKSLFPGMTDLPPIFATQVPPEFDARLPKLSDEDVEYIATSFPNLAKDVPISDMESVVRFFRQRLNASEHEEKEAYVQVDLDKDVEDETETGEFERLSGQSSQQRMRHDTATSCEIETAAAATITDDNMDTHKINIDKLQEFLVKLCTLCRANMVFIKEELAKLKTDADEQKNFIKSWYLEIVQAWEKSNQEIALRHREQTQRLTVDHELELSDMKATLTQKDEAIENQKKEMEDLKLEHQKEIEKLNNEHQSTKDLLEKTRQEVAGFEKKLEEIEVQKQKDIKEMQEKMHMDYKAEIESMRSRFRLVALTNMDRSPSESSLEKIERTDVIEISSHNAIVMQTKENAEVEKEEAVKDAVTKAEAEWKAKMEAELASVKAKLETEKQTTINEVTRRLLAEKNRQLDALRDREQALARECSKYRDTIQQLTDPETNDYDALLKTQFATLENEKAVLQQQVQDLKKELEKKADDAEKSRDDDSDGRSSPKEKEGKRSRSRCHTPYGLSAGTLSLSSCLPGHTVLVLWDPSHLNYTVLQEAPIMYFVHSDCLPALDLSIQAKNESERRLYAIATVDSKEYCYAKKSGNRFGMPRGSRFYRVRVRPPRTAPIAQPPCCDHRHKPVADAMRGSVLAVLGEQRPVKKWLTYMHAPDIQKSVDTSQSTSSNTDEASRVGEVATATLINLDSPVSTSEPASSGSANVPGEDQLDSIEASEQWQTSKMQLSTVSAVTDMECSVGRVVPEPLELTVSAVSVVSRGGGLQGSELAEEATP